MAREPEALQLVKFSDDGRRVELNHETLDKVVSKVKDKHVVVISVVGAYRRGKSFLLNFLLRYLKAKGESTWLDDLDSKVEGFNWRFDVNRVTTGIMLWPEAHIINDVAVLLLDTQGTFDNVTTMQESTAIVAISALISSVTIFNMSERIESKDLDNLRYFLEYGNLAYQQTEKQVQPFQQMLFLVRDWKFEDEHEFGYGGGEQLLNSVLEAGMENEDLRNVKENLKSSFQKSGCFLMPFPGGKVARDKNFQGKLSDILPNFRQQLKVLVESILASDKLTPKRIGGHEVLARDLPSFLHSLSTAFNSDELPTPTTLLQMFSETVARSMVRKAHANYEDNIKKAMSSGEVVDDIASLHKTIKNEEISHFRGSIKLGGDTLEDISIQQLDEMIEKTYKDYVVPLNTERIHVREAKKKVEEAEREGKKKNADKLIMEQKVSETEQMLALKEKERKEMEEKLNKAQEEKKLKEIELTKQEDLLKEQEQISKIKQEEAEKIQEELKKSNELKKAILSFFDNLESMISSFITRKQSMTSTELYSGILSTFGVKCTNANIPTLIKSYEGAMQSLSSEDPRRIILSAVCDQMRQSDGEQEEISTVHLTAFRDSIKNISSTLR